MEAPPPNSQDTPKPIKSIHTCLRHVSLVGPKVNGLLTNLDPVECDVHASTQRKIVARQRLRMKFFRLVHHNRDEPRHSHIVGMHTQPLDEPEIVSITGGTDHYTDTTTRECNQDLRQSDRSLPESCQRVETSCGCCLSVRHLDTHGETSQRHLLGAQSSAAKSPARSSAASFALLFLDFRIARFTRPPGGECALRNAHYVRTRLTPLRSTTSAQLLWGLSEGR